MIKTKQLYEGKAKKVWETEDPNLLIVDYKDDATAGNGAKKGTIHDKGIINNRMSNYMMKMLEKEGIPTHYVEEISDRETVVKRVTIVPLEVIVRNIAAGSLSKRLGLPEGTPLKRPVLEYCYKDDALGDPMVNEYHILAMEWCTKEELDTIAKYAFAVNDFMVKYLKTLNLDLVDFKIEFGRLSDGTIVLADEISPDTCRLWDCDTKEKLDKDRFRRDMGGVEEAYAEGCAAVKAAVAGKSNIMVGVVRKPGKKYETTIEEFPLSECANTEKKLPAEYINAEGNMITEAFLDYITPIIEGEHAPEFVNGIPRFAELKKVKA